MKVLSNEGLQGRLRPDESDRYIPAALGKQELRDLSEVSSLRGLFHILAEWTLLVAAAYLCHREGNFLLYLVTVVWIATRQHALMILLHDGTHYRLFRNRKLNDWVSEIALAWPVLISARAYRRNHFAHHRYLNTDGDPDWVRRKGDPAWVFPKPRAEMAGLLLRDLTGLGAIALLKLMKTVASKDVDVQRSFLLVRYGFYLIVIALALWMGAMKLLLLYWFVPLFTCLVFIFRIRSIAEHSGLPTTGSVYAQTRTVIPSMLERIFIAPKNVNFHLEHHLYPSVPFYRLPRLHAMLAAKPEFRDAHITRTYIGVLRECVSGAQTRSQSGIAAPAGFAIHAGAAAGSK